MPPKNHRSAFTTKFGKRTSVLETDIGISEPFHPSSGNPAPQIQQFRAVWDTGATRSVITQKVIAAIGLTSIDEIDNYTANGVRKAGEYLVNIYLPNNVAFSGIRVIDGDIYGTDTLIGMDIINKGDLAITHKFNKTWMTFQVPSSHNIDFVDEINIEKGKKGFRKPKKRGR